jgi:hypothetical protein
MSPYSGRSCWSSLSALSRNLEIAGRSKAALGVAQPAVAKNTGSGAVVSYNAAEPRTHAIAGPTGRDR